MKEKIFISKKNREIVLKKAEAYHSKGWRDGILEVSKEKYFLLVEPEIVYSEKEIENRINKCSDINYHLIVAAENDKNLIGLVHAFRHPAKKLQHIGEFGIWLLKEYRNEGIGKEMILYIEEWGKKYHLEKMCLSVFSCNKNAILLYEKCGYQIVGTNKKHIKIENEYYDLIHMEKFL